MKNSSICPDTTRLQRWRGVWWLALLLGWTLLGWTPPGYALDPARTLTQYVRQHWGAESGFPSGPVYAISQTPDGYLWIGTDAGLVRFDGVRFELMKDPTASFTVNSVLGLTPDPEGHLWVRLPRPTLLRYRQGQFENVMADYGIPRVTVAAVSRTWEGALLLWILQGEGRAVVQRGARFETVAAPAGLSRSPVLAIAQLPNGEIWLGTRDAGLYRLRGNQAESVTAGLPDLKVNCLLPTPSGELWVGTDGGVVRWNGATLTHAGLPTDLNKIQALSLTLDRDSNLWIGTNAQGLLRLNARGLATLPGTRSASEAITAVFEDREGNLWFGSANGLERWRDSVFVTYPAPAGLASEKSGPVFVDGNLRTWFAPAAGGLYWLQDGQPVPVTAAGLSQDVVYSLAGSSSNDGATELWLGRQRGGLTRLRLNGSASQAVTYTQKDGLAQNSVYAVHQSRDGSVWAGTLSGGVSHFQQGRFTTYTRADGLASNTVTALLESADGSMWFGTPQGLSALAQGRWQTYTKQHGLPADSVNCLSASGTDGLWIGTASGLAHWRAGRFQPLPALPELLREQILGLAEDAAGSLWLATATHVLRVPCDKLLSGQLKENDVREFGLADGLHSVEGVKRQRSVVQDASGQLWFSLNRGLSVVAPARLKGELTPALAQVQTLTADGVSFDPLQAQRLPGGAQRITFGFTGLGLALPERLRFRYKLDGFDATWSAPSATREAPYTNLGPGAYRFRVQASHGDGNWNGPEAVFSFQVAPLFWQTWWFRAALVLAGGGLVLAVYQLRLRQLTRRMNLRFEERLAERTRIAQELHDTLLQGYLSAALQLHIAVDTLPEDTPNRPLFERILQMVGQVTEEGRNAIRGLRAVDSTSFDLETALARVPQELGAQEVWQQERFRVIVQGQPQPLHPLWRDEVYRIGREALVNAFRHAHAQTIEVELEYAPRTLRLCVRDDGRGIAPQVLETGRAGHWGLVGMRERAERIGARLTVRSRPGSGTEIELAVPGQFAFEKPTAQRAWRWLAFARRRFKLKQTKEEGRK